jgi:hypothetical protein
VTTFRNRFHGTSATVRANDGEVVSGRVYRRVVRALCGMEDCRCGTFDNGAELLEVVERRWSGPRRYVVYTEVQS